MEKQNNNGEKAAKKRELEVKEWNVDNTVYVQGDVIGTYCNNARVEFSNWDMAITFGEIVGERDKKLAVLPRVKVMMSLQFAKAFSKLIAENMKRFEEQVSEIQEFTPTKIIDR